MPFSLLQCVLEFPLACGITVGTPVRIRGVPVGSVLSVNPSLEKVEVLVEVRRARTAPARPVHALHWKTSVRVANALRHRCSSSPMTQLAGINSPVGCKAASAAGACRHGTGPGVHARWLFVS